MGQNRPSRMGNLSYMACSAFGAEKDDVAAART